MNTNRLIQTALVATSLLGAGLLRAADAPKLETTKDKVSYAIGMDLGIKIKRAGFDVDTAIIAAAIERARIKKLQAQSEDKAEGDKE